jgi:hypothetical protein
MIGSLKYVLFCWLSALLLVAFWAKATVSLEQQKPITPAQKQTTSAKSVSTILVLPYEKFGPSSLPYDLLGSEWYQWQVPICGCDPNEKFDVKVAVYRIVSLRRVKALYPVVKGKSDYRYLKYDVALRWLAKKIAGFELWQKEDDPTVKEMWAEGIATLKNTQAQILESLGQ